METNVTKLDLASWCGFAMFATSGVITPICLPEISRALSTNLAEGGGMETARAFVVVLVILLGGLFAQKWGKKRFITMGQYLLAAGLFLVSVSQSYLTLIIALMITGIGGGFTEALINPLVVDIHPHDSGKYLNITNAFFSIGAMTAALLFGELLTLGLSWRTIFQIAAVGALTIGVWFNLSHFPPAVWDEPFAWNVVRKILVLPGFWLFAIAIALGAGVESGFTFWSRSYVETYLKDIPRAGAIAVVIFAGMMAAGRLLTARLSRAMSLRMIMLCSALLGVIVSGLIPFASNLPVFYVLLALAGLATACFWPTILAEAAGYLKVNATILFVLLATFGIAGFGFIPWVMGVIGDRTNLRMGFSVIPGLFVILIITLLIEWQMSRNKS